MSSGYATEAEKQFLSKLGTYATKADHKTPLGSKLDLLCGYQRSIPNRSYWGSINKLEIEQYVMHLIEREIILN